MSDEDDEIEERPLSEKMRQALMRVAEEIEAEFPRPALALSTVQALVERRLVATVAVGRGGDLVAVLTPTGRRLAKRMAAA